jgi:hypothetical protein
LTEFDEAWAAPELFVYAIGDYTEAGNKKALIPHEGCRPNS